MAWSSNFSSKNSATKKAIQYVISINDVLADSEYLGKLTDEPWYMEFFKVIMLSIGILATMFFIFVIGNIKRNRIKRNLKKVLKVPTYK